MQSLSISSKAFENGDNIPAKYTCDGAELSPPLTWESVPDGTESLALVMDDPDAPAGTWVHWVVYNLPLDKVRLKEGVSKQKILEDESKQGVNDFGKIGYGGPCPPPGKPHRYYFKLYALDTVLDLPAGVSKQDLESAMKGHILSKGELMGLYKR